MPGFEEDKQLFSWDHLEPEFTTWIFLWTRTFAAPASLRSACVDNYGTCYVDDIGNNIAHIITRANALTNVASYQHGPLAAGFPEYFDPHSVGAKYVTHIEIAVGRTFRVYRRGVLLYPRLITTDDANNTYINYHSMSPDGRYLLLITDHTVAGALRGAALYEGR